MQIRNKLINHIMINGKKKTSEKILLKSFKEIQKNSKKQSEDLIKLAIIHSTPIFKLHRIINKNRKKKKNKKNQTFIIKLQKIKNKNKKKKKVKEIPAFITKTISRTSLAIKFILSSIKNKKSNNLYIKLKQEILTAAQSKGPSIELKNNLQKQILLKKRFFTYYRWK